MPPVNTKAIVIVPVPAAPAEGVKILDAKIDRSFLLLENKGADAIEVSLDGPLSVDANEVQRIVFSATPTAGGFKVTFLGVETAEVLFSEGNAELQTALEDLAGIGVGNVVVAGSFAAGFDITFQADLAAAPQPGLVVTTNTLTDNGAIADEVQTLTFSATPDLGDFKLKINGQTTVAIDNADAAIDVENALNGLASLSGVSVAGTFGAGFVITFAGADGDTPQDLLEVVDNTLEDSAGAVDAVQAIEFAGTPDGVPDEGTFVLMFEGDETTPLAFDATAGDIQTAMRALASIGGANITVTGSFAAGFEATFIAALDETPQELIVVRLNDLLRGSNPVRIDISETAAGLTGTPVTTTLVETTPGVGLATVTTTVSETTPGSTVSGGILLAGGDRHPFDDGIPVGELWAKATGGTPTLEITEGQ